MSAAAKRLLPVSAALLLLAQVRSGAFAGSVLGEPASIITLSGAMGLGVVDREKKPGA